MIDGYARQAIEAARNRRAVLFVVPNETPIGLAFKELAESIQKIGVNGFRFLEGKRLVEHGSGGWIKITCDRLILKNDDVDRIEINEIAGARYLSREAQQIVAGRMKKAL